MKLKVLMPLNHKGKVYQNGDSIDVPVEKVAIFINKGWAAKFEKKEAKPKKVTKELKKDSIETKSDATNKD
ncbi:MAG: hypothetical protein H8E16_00990 [Flavobacteriales bacterium]|jgi:hypothetical protein|nr:hypothetical protein [Flavobacteriales bacterium]